MPIANDRFLRACRRQAVDATPVWFMRQAGRYQPEYRKIRQSHSLLEICRNPQLCAEVTMLPVQQLGVDAAILFSDITLPLEPMGVAFELREQVGPVIHQPVAQASDVDRLRPLRPEEDLPFVLETVRILVRELKVPLIGFAGAPFTLASYLIEGGPSRSFVRTRRMMYADPGLWHALMERLAHSVAAHLVAQAQAGCTALQIFDSWVGCLDPDAYREFVMPHMRRLFDRVAAAQVPVIHFAVESGSLLEAMREAGGDVIGVDWRTPIDQAWARVGPGVGIQGNLDPVRLLGPWEGVREGALQVLERARRLGWPGHLFNLGHGVLPETPVNALRRLVDLVHEASTAGAVPAAEAPSIAPVSARSGGTGSITGSGSASGPTSSRRPSTTPVQGVGEPATGHRVPPSDRGVLLMAYGSPASLEELEPYYTHIRGGRPPSPQLLAELRQRYEAIGGSSPLAAITFRLARVLEERLGLRVYVGMKHAPPFIAQAVRQMAQDGVRRAVGIALAPQFSRMSVGSYIDAACRAAEGLAGEPAGDAGREPGGAAPIAFRFVESWATYPPYIRALASRLRAALKRLGPEPAVLFTAHSLPERIRSWSDPYPQELERTCHAVAQEAGLASWRFAYQSAGRTSEPWLGPGLAQALGELQAAGHREVLVCPVGFVADHLEVLYDIDVEAQGLARKLGLRLGRTESLNDAPDFADALAALVRETMAP